MRFIIPPPVPKDINAHWILYPSGDNGGVLIGDPYPISNSFMDREVLYLDITYFVCDYHSITKIKQNVEEGMIVYITDSSDSQRRNAVRLIGCFIKLWFHKDSFEEVVAFFDAILKTRVCTKHSYVTLTMRLCDEVEKYRRPLTVLVCGDRNSGSSFEELIHFELRTLPEGSVIVHGACYGIDTTAHKIAVKLGLEVKPYPAEWDKYGKGAGPIKNKAMLNENPDLVLAFHPDIEMSKGTKNMVMQAYDYINTKTGRKPDIFINSLKRKSNLREHFEKYGYGNFKDI